MGRHAGRVLIDASRADVIPIVSIYVNPTQFGPREDFSKYPRPTEADVAACKKAGVDLIFMPQHTEIYPPGDQTRVRPGRLAEALCGPFRPGHFEGVCTVVARLFNIVQPDAAYFGQKDAQQLAIIRRMTFDLRLPVEIIACPIVREHDGLAMSSRNAYLSAENRKRSLCLYRALCRSGCADRGRRATGRSSQDAGNYRHGGERSDRLFEPGRSGDAGGRGRFGAKWSDCGVVLGATRLIDNILVDLK
jgi:pantoate--beta-alanine ligase